MSDLSTPPQTKNAGASDARRRWIWLFLKWALCLLVVAFVAKRGYELWSADEGQFELAEVQPGWLVLAGCVYLIGWMPSVWFWLKLMSRSGGDEIRFDFGARAYYCGHLGKYVPGKAMVLVIRAALVKEYVSRATFAALMAAYETLLFMGSGLAVALALLPATVLALLPQAARPDWLQSAANDAWIPCVVIALLCLLALPIISRFLTLIADKMAPRESGQDDASSRIPARLVGAGLLAFLVSWSIHGLSLGLTIRSVSSESFSLVDWPVWTGAVAMATSVGFLMIFAPGGIGVREGLLIEVLANQPDIGERQAVVVALLLRIVWFVAEIGAAAALYYCVRPNNFRSESPLNQ